MLALCAALLLPEAASVCSLSSPNLPRVVRHARAESSVSVSPEGPLLAASRTSRASENATRPAAPPRLTFAKIREPLEVPNLLALQVDSFDWLLGNEIWKDRIAAGKAAGRTGLSSKSGLQEIFDPKNSVDECKERDFTYSAPLFVTAEFTNNETGEIKSQTVFMGDFPLMTNKGT